MKKILITLLFCFSSVFAFEHLTEENFQEKLKGKNAIVDFYATWCPPCKVLAKNMIGFDKLKPTDVTIYKVDIDDYKSLAIENGVRALPTLLYFKDGKVVAKEVGIKDIPQLTNSVNKHFK